MKKQLQVKSNQAGVSMVELSVVLVVVALLSVAIFLGLEANARRVAVQDNVSQITETAAGLKKNFGQSNSYAQLTPVAVGTTLAVQSRIIPPQLRVAGTTTALNSYGGAIGVVVSPIADCVTANSCVNLSWASVPQAQCVDLVLGVESGARRVLVGAVVVKPLNGVLALAALGTACETAVTSLVTLQIGR